MKEKLDVGDEGEETALERFAVLVVEPEVMDWSRTNVSTTERAGVGGGVRGGRAKGRGGTELTRLSGLPSQEKPPVRQVFARDEAGIWVGRKVAP